ncbi:hypothetical protein AXF42_Ash016307 [Apostasia shenzhenica]|uniref:RHOMBOID-like protein n=1 Tax=Apostasia shenzhenica TaxID=1088818 RepID=A0A2H9ZXC8_9ASPA|nr:hypothetical protein AXF42_Ash016307 [Apostasia shenzhenica]
MTQSNSVSRNPVPPPPASPPPPAMEKDALAAGKDDVRLDLDATPEESGGDSDDHRLPFFGRRHRGSENTWAISLFVVLHLVAFVATMVVNNCPEKSAGDCSLRSLGRFSFQPLAENPLLGPSSSTLTKMGALQQTLFLQHRQRWRVLSCLLLHAGFIHLIVNLSCVILIGIHLEQDFGSLRAVVIYLFSAFQGSLVSANFVQHVPAVASSAALFGLLGATLSNFIRNWHIYSAKFRAVVVLSLITIINFAMGFLPYIDNVANIGGFVSGILLGLALLFNPQLSELERRKGLFDYDLNSSVKLRQKLDKPLLRIIALLILIFILAGGAVAVLLGADVTERCVWCRYIDCLPTKLWTCNRKANPCKAFMKGGKLNITCTADHRFRMYPFANISDERIGDLCSIVCS